MFLSYCQKKKSKGKQSVRTTAKQSHSRNSIILQVMCTTIPGCWWIWLLPTRSSQSLLSVSCYSYEFRNKSAHTVTIHYPCPWGSSELFHVLKVSAKLVRIPESLPCPLKGAPILRASKLLRHHAAISVSKTCSKWLRNGERSSVLFFGPKS